jgi:hypothetical protein
MVLVLFFVFVAFRASRADKHEVSGEKDAVNAPFSIPWSAAGLW